MDFPRLAAYFRPRRLSPEPSSGRERFHFRLKREKLALSPNTARGSLRRAAFAEGQERRGAALRRVGDGEIAVGPFRGRRGAGEPNRRQSEFLKERFIWT